MNLIKISLLLVVGSLSVALCLGQSLLASHLLGRPKPDLERFLGREVVVRGGTMPYLLFHPPGLVEATVDNPGDKMTTLVFKFKNLRSPKSCLLALGLSAAHAPATPGSAGIFGGLTRSRVPISGVGLPAPWKAQYFEYATANPARMKRMRPQILAASGPAKMKLIQSCYDWRSAIEIRKGG